MSMAVAILGTGLVGRAWAIAFARAGASCRLFDATPGAAHTARERIAILLDDMVEAGLLDASGPLLGRLEPVETLAAALDGVAWLQESVPEDLDLKRRVWAEIDALAPPTALLASSTSAIVPSTFTEPLACRARCFVAHPLNPPYLIPAAELVPAPWTAPETMTRAADILTGIGMAPISMTRELDGFVMNRLQGALLEEAFRLVDGGYCSTEDIDRGLKHGLALRWSFMGPFETIDLNAPLRRARLLRTLPAHLRAAAPVDAEPCRLDGTRARSDRGGAPCRLARGPAGGPPALARSPPHGTGRPQEERVEARSETDRPWTRSSSPARSPGAIHTPSMSPHLPVTPEEIADAAIGAAEAGAAIVHLHARDPETGRPDQAPEAFKPFLQVIKQRSDCVINLTTGGAPSMTIEERVKPAAIFAPEVASLNMGSMNFGLFPMLDRFKTFKHEWERQHLENSRNLVFKNTYQDIEYILTTCAANNTRFEFECYDISHLYNLAHFLDRGLVRPPLFVQSVFGILGGIGPHPEDVMHMKRTADRLFGKDYRWSVLGAGRNQLPIAAISAAMGANVRVGLEDSLWLGKGKLAESNAAQVRAARQIIEGLGREIATPDEARAILQLKGPHDVQF